MTNGPPNEAWDRILAERLSRKLRSGAGRGGAEDGPPPAGQGGAGLARAAQPARPARPALSPHGTAPGPAASGRRAGGAESATRAAARPGSALLTSRDEKRALNILAGRGRSRAAGVLVAAAAAVVATSGGAFLVSGRLGGGSERDAGDISLAREMSPPQELAAPLPAARARAADAPVFRVVFRRPGTDRIDLGGPLVDLDLSPPTEARPRPDRAPPE